jgi:hypothetical protein
LLVVAIVIWLMVIAVSILEVLQFLYAWRTFTSKEGRFSVALPGRPTQAVQQAGDGSNAGGQTHTFGVTNPYIQSNFFVAYEDIPETTKIGEYPSIFLKQVVDEATASMGGTDIYSTPAKVGRYPAYDVSLSTKETNGRMMKFRFVLAGRRVYRIAIAPFPKDNAENIIKYYFDSFTILDNP